MTLIAAGLLLSALPDAAEAAELNIPSLAKAPLAKGAGYDRMNGSRRVRVLQRQLRRLGHRPGPIDGLFGPLTDAAVRRFQRHAGLRTDGVVGPRTGTHLARNMAAVHRRAVQRRQVDRRPEIHRSLVNDGRAVHKQPDTRAPRPTAPASYGNMLRTVLLVVGVLIALCVGLTLRLLPGPSRADEARRRDGDLGDHTPPVGGPAVAPHRSVDVGEGNRARAPIADHREDSQRQAPRPTPQPEAVAAAVPRPEEGERRPPISGVAVIGYVSVGEQERLANGDDYAAQAQAIGTFCARRGLRLTRIVRDVEGVADTRGPAPGLQHACQLLARGEAHGLVVQDLGRLTRSPAKLGLFLRWLADAGRVLIAIDNQLDTSSGAGRATAKMLIEVGEWDRQRAAQRRPGNRSKHGGGRRPAVRDVPELHARIAAMREEGLSLHAIAERLNAEGIPTLRGGARWRPSSVQAAVGYKRPTARNDLGGLGLPSPQSASGGAGGER